MAALDTELMPEGVWSAPDRQKAQYRQFKAWPPVDMPMQIPVAPHEVAEGMTWPPTRLWNRNNRLGLWRRVWRGDLTDFIGRYSTGFGRGRITYRDDTQGWGNVGDEGATVGAPVVINYARRYTDIVSSLMLTTEPPDELADPIQATIMQTMRDGKAYVIRRGDDIEAVEAMWCFETSPMWEPGNSSTATLYVVRPFVSSQATWDLPDMVEIIQIGGGIASTWTARWDQAWEYGGIGPQITPAVHTEGAWASSANPPMDYGWGQPAIQDLVPPMAAIALRYTGADAVLAAHESPTLMVPIPNADIGSLLAIDDDRQSGDYTAYGRKLAVDMISRLRDHNVAWAPDGVHMPQYLTWDGNLQDSWTMIDLLKAEIRNQTGVPASLEQEGADIASGTALNQMLLILHATTKQLKRQVHTAYENVYGTFTWLNAFEEAFAKAASQGGMPVGAGGYHAAIPPAPTPPMLEAVPDA